MEEKEYEAVPEEEPNSCKGCVTECGSELCARLGCVHQNYIYKEVEK